MAVMRAAAVRVVVAAVAVGVRVRVGRAADPVVGSVVAAVRDLAALVMEGEEATALASSEGASRVVVGREAVRAVDLGVAARAVVVTVVAATEAVAAVARWWWRVGGGGEEAVVRWRRQGWWWRWRWRAAGGWAVVATAPAAAVAGLLEAVVWRRLGWRG